MIAFYAVDGSSNAGAAAINDTNGEAITKNPSLDAASMAGTATSSSPTTPSNNIAGGMIDAALKMMNINSAILKRELLNFILPEIANVRKHTLDLHATLGKYAIHISMRRRVKQFNL